MRSILAVSDLTPASDGALSANARMFVAPGAVLMAVGGLLAYHLIASAASQNG